MHCIYEKFPLAPMGVLAPLSAHARPFAQSPITLADIFWRMCLQSNLHHFFFLNAKFRNPTTTPSVVLNSRGNPNKNKRKNT